MKQHEVQSSLDNQRQVCESQTAPYNELILENLNVTVDKKAITDSIKAEHILDITSW